MLIHFSVHSVLFSLFNFTLTVLLYTALGFITSFLTITIYYRSFGTIPFLEGPMYSQSTYV